MTEAELRPKAWSARFRLMGFCVGDTQDPIWWTCKGKFMFKFQFEKYEFPPLMDYDKAKEVADVDDRRKIYSVWQKPYCRRFRLHKL